MNPSNPLESVFYISIPENFAASDEAFKIDPKISLQRIQNRDVIEIYEKLDFLQATEKRYEDIISEYQDKNTGMNIIIIDATKSPDEVEKQILSVLEPVFLR